MIHNIFALAIIGVAGSILLHHPSPVRGADSIDTSRGDRMLSAYFANETARLSEACLADVNSWDDWTVRRDTYRQQLREMLGLDPMPERTPLQPVITGQVDHPEFTVEKLHFQSLPKLYVTANLYIPKQLNGPMPAVLYVCGHGRANKHGVSYGNKVKYQHHGAWFARNGYVCLVIDTLQLGEIEGLHHGTNRLEQWWWNARGYTPAGVEAWNSIRALDYLESRSEVDSQRMAVTGRSGGGGYSWYLTALDDRIQATVPVAGITNLKNHVVDGCIEGHCDCMFFINTYRWDYPQLAALVAPRPLLISNSDQDHIFPLDGVLDVYNKVRRLYELGGNLDRLGLQITYGPHKDTQVLQVHAFQWINRHIQGDDAPIDKLAEQFFEWEDLRVFDTLPNDEINTTVQELFVPSAPQAEVSTSFAAWNKQRDEWLYLLREKCFAGWPDEVDSPVQSPMLRLAFKTTSRDMQLWAYDFESQEQVSLRLFVLLPVDATPGELNFVTLEPLDARGWSEFVSAMHVKFADEFAEETPLEPDAVGYAALKRRVAEGRGVAYIAPRGIGPTAWGGTPKQQTHILRRFMLLGQTLDSMRVWDVRRALQALRQVDGLSEVSISLDGKREMAGIALYASLFEPNISELVLRELASSHRERPNFLNVLRFLDIPQAVAMAAERSHVTIHNESASDWEYPLAVAKQLGLEGHLQIQETAVEGK